MAEFNDDILLSLTFGPVADGERRLLERLLAGSEGVTAFRLGDDGTLVVSVRSVEGEVDLVRVLAAAGIYPHSARELGASDPGGPHAC